MAAFSTASSSAAWSCGAAFDHAAKAERLRHVNAALQDPAVWCDPQKAQALSKEKKLLDGVVVTLDDLSRNLADAAELFALCRDDGDEDMLAAIERDAAKFQAEIERLEFQRMFCHDADSGSCFLDIQAGAGGTEAQSFAAMLARQYIKYAERKGFNARLVDDSPSEPNCLKSCTLRIEGDYAYGLLRTET